MASQRQKPGKPAQPKPEKGRSQAAHDDTVITALGLKEATPTDAMAAYFNKCEEKLGFVPNVLRAYAFDMPKLEAFVAMYNDLMLAPSGLSKLEREMIAVAVSSVNRCYYCLTAHGAAVRALSDDPVLGELMAMNYRAARLAARARDARFRREAHRRAVGDRGARPRGAAPGRLLGPRHLGHRGGGGLLQHVEPGGERDGYAANPVYHVSNHDNRTLGGMLMIAKPILATVGNARRPHSSHAQTPRALSWEEMMVPAVDADIQIYVRNKRPANLTTFRPERTVFYVHGATYPASTSFDLPLDGLSWMDYLAARGYDVFLLDVRGYGRSTRPPEVAEKPDAHGPIVRRHRSARHRRGGRLHPQAPQHPAPQPDRLVVGHRR